LTGYIQYYKKMVGQTQSPWVRQNPKFLSDPMSDRKKKVFANSVIPNVWYNSYLRFCPKGIDQCLILFLNYIIFIVFTPFIYFRFQSSPFVKTITTRLVIWEIHDFADGYCLRNPWLCWWIWSEKSILKKQINDSKYLSLRQYPSAKPGISQTISISKVMEFSDNIHQQSHGFLRQYPSAKSWISQITNRVVIAK
jgi:hypothetical protein